MNGEKTISITRELTVRELAELLGVEVVPVVKRLFDRGLMRTIDGQTVDVETAKAVARDMGFEVE